MDWKTAVYKERNHPGKLTAQEKKVNSTEELGQRKNWGKGETR